MHRSTLRMLTFIPSTGARLKPWTTAAKSVFVSPIARPLVVPVTSRRRLRWAAKRAELTPVRMSEVVDKVAVEEEVDPGEVSGTSLRIIRYPHPLLRAENVAVPEDGFGDELRQLAREMLLIMYASGGVGVAAPQVGINKRLIVFNPEGSEKAFIQEVVMVNPTIVATSKKMLVEPEGCLSFPGMGGNVSRHEWVKVEGYRLNGKKFKVKFEGWKAKIFQHEFDHLEGVMYIDKLALDEDRERVKERLDQLVEEYRSNPYQGMDPAM